MWIKVIFLVVILLSIQNRAYCCKKIETALANVIATNEAKSSGDVGKSQIVLGKDRLLIQGNLDLKWLYAKVTKDIDWNQLISNMFENLAAIFDSRRQFKNILIRILSDIRMRCNESKLKCFLGTIQDAARYAQKTKRLVVIYIEDGDYRSPSPSSSFFRTALSDPAIGSLLNDEFVFFAGSTRHGSTKKIARDLNARKYVDFPLFAVVNPNSIFDESSNLTNPDATPELLTKLKLPQAEIASGKIARFLQRMKEVHGPKVFLIGGDAPVLPPATIGKHSDQVDAVASSGSNDRLHYSPIARASFHAAGQPAGPPA